MLNREIRQAKDVFDTEFLHQAAAMGFQRSRYGFLNVTGLRVFVLGAFWCKTVYSHFMSIAEKLVRQSVSLPARVARQVKSLAKTGNTSANRVIVNLIESGIEAREHERKRFFELADRLAHSRDADDQKRLKKELARLTFGE